MPLKQSVTSEVRFCSQCGAKVVSGASFCVECGTGVGTAGKPARHASSAGRYAPVIVVVSVIVVVGTAASIGFFSPKPAPSVPGRQPAASTTPAQMPEGHPPIAIPDDVKQTIRDMAKSAEARPEDLELWKRLAEVQYRAGQIDPTYLPEAQISFQHVLDRQPDNTDALRNLGNIAFDREQPDKASDYYRRYLALKPADPNVETDLATMQLALGKTDVAIAGYQKVIAANPTFFQARFNLGLAYHRAGKLNEAVAALQEARPLAPDDRARQQLEQVLARMQGSDAVATGESSPPSLRAGIEGFFRKHQIIGPKIDRFDWEGERTVRVLLHDFPIEAMPEFVRKQMVDRISGQIKEQKAAVAVTDPVTVQLVDSASAKVMETVTQ
jgi:Flp pilus assembly protein TadD